MQPLPELVTRLEQALAPEPPASLKEGGMFRDGYHAELDELRRATTEGRDWIAALQEREIDATGIRSLKIRYNSVFGYYIEITKSNLGSVPAHYQRKQTTAGGERFVTPELKETESRILGAEERAHQLETQLFIELRQEVLRETASLQRTAGAIGAFDALAGLAETARQFNYCRPRLAEPGAIRIREGRHPVLDQQFAGEKFVPNDVSLDRAENRLIVLTGPNMAGKSTYLRQTALLVLMAQTGSFIPAAEAEIGLVDRIFTRVGANDDLSKGQSTFLVEMNETANIVHHATAQSLVILDEIGRGHLDLRRFVDCVERGRAPARPGGRVDALRHALPRADRDGRHAPGGKEFYRGRARVERRDRVPASHRGRGGGPLLRDSGRAARGIAAGNHRPGEGNPRTAGSGRHEGGSFPRAVSHRGAPAQSRVQARMNRPRAFTWFAEEAATGPAKR